MAIRPVGDELLAVQPGMTKIEACTDAPAQVRISAARAANAVATANNTTVR